MSLDSDVYATLLDACDNVYPIALPPKAVYPAIVYQTISEFRGRSHDGTSLIGRLYQFTVWDTSPTVTREVTRGVIDLWEPQIGRALIESRGGETYNPDLKITGSRVDVRIYYGSEESS